MGGEVDRIRLVVVGFSWRELARERCGRGAGALVHEVLGQHLAQVMLVDDQQLVEKPPAQGADEPFTDPVRPGRPRPSRNPGRVVAGRQVPP
jgi:hypothetical protein